MKLSVTRELLIAGVAVIASIAVLPGLIYTVGTKLFGAYGIAGGMSSMYQATLTDLAKPTVAAWTIALCPAVCIVLLRLLFGLSQSSVAETAARSRHEPTV
jgi:hypothetical protein